MADWKCPSCGEKNSRSAVTCISCGAARPAKKSNTAYICIAAAAVLIVGGAANSNKKSPETSSVQTSAAVSETSYTAAAAHTNL